MLRSDHSFWSTCYGQWGGVGRGGGRGEAGGESLSWEAFVLGEDFAWSLGNGRLLFSVRGRREAFVPTYGVQENVEV